MAEIQRGEQTQQQIAVVPPQYAHQVRGTVGVAVAELTFPSVSESILIENTHATQELRVYFKSSASGWNMDYKSIAAGGVFSLNLRTDRIRIQGSGAGTTYELLVTLE